MMTTVRIRPRKKNERNNETNGSGVQGIRLRIDIFEVRRRGGEENRFSHYGIDKRAEIQNATRHGFKFTKCKSPDWPKRISKTKEKKRQNKKKIERRGGAFRRKSSSKKWEYQPP
jgi:hypothetical protein